jgi:DNA helicase-2/ATP-dependent DNA helicase PcrA
MPATIIAKGLTDSQKKAVQSDKRRLLIIAGAGSGKTEVMARRIAWWVGVDNVPKERIVAFTFTERAAEEMKFRIRYWLGRITPEGKEVSLGGMYIGTIHGFCISKIREYWPDEYHNYDILDEGAKISLILRGFNGLLGLKGLKESLGCGQYETIDRFVQAYDQLHEHNRFTCQLATDTPPVELGETEREWCKKARLLTKVGKSASARAFAESAARYYAYLRCRRFLDFSTSQTEFISKLKNDSRRLKTLTDSAIHLVVDEIQDINPIQRELMCMLIGNKGKLTAVGDHRQSIYGFRGAKVKITAELWEEFKTAKDADVCDLQENFRSTPRVIDIANRWAKTIGQLKTMKTLEMRHGNKKRIDQHDSHVALISFKERTTEAEWIAKAIKTLVPSEKEGASHDKRDGSDRGLTLSDMAVLVRSTSDVRSYMEALESAGIPCVVRAGPDLFSQPEVLFFIAALAITAECQEFFGAPHNKKSLPARISSVLGCGPTPEQVLPAAAEAIRKAGLIFTPKVEARVLLAAKAIADRIKAGVALPKGKASIFRDPKLREFVSKPGELRRVFPQQIFHMLLSETEVEKWDTCSGRGQSALFHLGSLGGLITAIETPGWTSAKDYHWQIIGLCQYGAEEGRAEEQPLIVRPDAVNILTIHGAKGLEFPAVFLADVNALKFPSNYAARKLDLPLDGDIVEEIDIESLSDNENHDGERRLMYVAVTRAERFLFISHSGKKTSKFIKELKEHVKESNGLVTDNSEELLAKLRYSPKEHWRDIRIATSFSDLRYYLECPHDFYLRKVLGFAPTIDQAFGYGRGVHNLMRAVHSDPKKWAVLAKDRVALEKEIGKLIQDGLFYLRYTVGAPADNMRKKGTDIVADYIQRHADELQRLKFEPEKEFETLLEYDDRQGGALISGAIDVIRQENPPRVTLIDFKSGDPESDKHQKLDEEEMKLQVALYAIAAKKELEYIPEQGLVRYLDASDGKKSELKVPLDEKALKEAQEKVMDTAKKIRDRQFNYGPNCKGEVVRCANCDFVGFCGMKAAYDYKESE